MRVNIKSKQTKKLNGKIIAFHKSYFQQFRKGTDLDDSDLMKSFNPQMNSQKMFKTNFKFTYGDTGNKSGKSGSLFFFTWDNKFIVKTITRSEFLVLFKLVPKMNQLEESSLLAKAHGLYQLKLHNFSTIYLHVQ